MRKLYVGIMAGLIVFVLFLISQDNLAQPFNKNKEKLEKTVESDSLMKVDSDAIKSLDQKVHDMEKYVNESQKYIDASQKNLDLWLKYLAFTLSILIGYSIFNGLKLRDLAKEELVEIRRIKEEIKRSANDAEDRLTDIKGQIKQIENTANNAKNIEEEMSKKLNEIGGMKEVTLDEKQKNIINDSIEKAKSDLQSSGIDAFKNLYLAKALKAYAEDKWEDSLRLWNIYIDLDDSNEMAFYRRGTTLGFMGDGNNNANGELEKAIVDFNTAIMLKPDFSEALHNRATAYLKLNRYEDALKDYNEAIRLNPKDKLAYENRAETFEALGRNKEAEEDRQKSKTIE